MRNSEYDGEKVACHFMDCWFFKYKESDWPFEDCFICNRNEDIKGSTKDLYELEK